MHYQFFRAKPLSIAATTGLGIVMMTAAVASAGTPAHPSAAVSDGALIISGTDGGDGITVSANPVTNAVIVDFGDGTLPQRFDATTFTTISAFLGAGDDQFSVSPGSPTPATLPLTVEGGRGADTITSGPAADSLSGGGGNDTVNAGDGNDIIVGNHGNDFVNGQRGNDTEDLGAGDDTTTWLPGDGSDTIDGEHGQDALDFVGANIAETTALTADGSHAIFTRDVATIRMDLNNVERFAFTALGGADKVNVGDLNGTDLRHVNLDLSGTAGSGVGDGQADAVTVDGTDNADHVSVDASDSTVDVNGLHTDVAISGPDATADHLQVNGFGGNDSVRVDEAASALLPTSVDLGIGQR